MFYSLNLGCSGCLILQRISYKGIYIGFHYESASDEVSSYVFLVFLSNHSGRLPDFFLEALFQRSALLYFDGVQGIILCLRREYAGRTLR